ncbi:MAG: acetate--CoA ligase [Acidimicrobiia bacterium]
MRAATIVKARGSSLTPPNLADYEATRASFSWSAARAELDGLPGGGLNIAHECVDRHVATRGDVVALRCLSRSGNVVDISYRALAAATSRFANALAALGVLRGDRVFVLTDRIPELYVAALGALKHGCVVCTLFSAFGPEPIRQRLELGGARVLVTTDRLYRRKVASIRGDMPSLEHALVVGASDDTAADRGTCDFASLVDAAPEEYDVARTRPDDPALLHFTSGTTGTPKGAVHVHDAVLTHVVTGRFALDLHDDDVFWCTADPGWVTGTSYGIVAPLAIGLRNIVDEREFDPARWYEVLEQEDVSVWYTAPTAIRMMMKSGAAMARERDFRHLRFIASVGEPLNPEAVRWGVDAFGLPIHDNWWQTETGGIMIANFAGMDIRPGSMGRPVPGVDAAILRRDDRGELVLHDGAPEIVDDPMVEGELALRRGWPSMFREYLGAPDRYAACFAGDWYLTGDLAERDADGYFWFVGRGDDVIKSAGHLIGPFEVESALMEHPAVAEVGVIGVADPVAGQVVKAFVALRPGHEASDTLRLELIGFARSRLGAAIAPKQLEFTADLPKTRSGKIMRRLLRARELGLPEGDVSTVETGA